MKIKSLLWTAIGFLFINLNITVSGVDILPDLAGYLILFVCFSLLAFHERSFLRARVLTMPLILLQFVFILKLVDNDGVLLVLRVVGVLGSLLTAFYAFASMGRLAVTFEEDHLRRPVDISFAFYAIAAALPFIAAIAPDIDKLCLFAALCLCLYVFNALIRCYRLILLPVEVPPEELKEAIFSADGPDDGILPDADGDTERTAQSHRRTRTDDEDEEDDEDKDDEDEMHDE